MACTNESEKAEMRLKPNSPGNFRTAVSDILSDASFFISLHACHTSFPPFPKIVRLERYIQNKFCTLCTALSEVMSQSLRS